MKKLINSYNGGNQINGILTEFCEFCQKNISCDKCKKFYEQLANSDDGKYICPYGFCCIKSNDEIYNSLVVNELCNIPKLKLKLDLKQKVFKECEINELQELQDELNCNEYQNNIIEINVNNLLHDIIKANNLIKTKLEKVDKNVIYNLNDKSRITSSYYLADFVRLRAELYKTIVNPGIASVGTARNREAYKMWDIYRHIFNEIGKEKNINISMKTYDNDTKNETENVSTIIKAKDSVSTLPFIIFDNAIKYSQNDTTIYVSMYQTKGILQKIIVENTTSYVITEDPKLFFNRGYRSTNNTSKSSGSGLGLDIAKQICDSNNISIELLLSKNADGKQTFLMILEFKKDVNE